MAPDPYTAHSEAEINLQSNSIRLVRPGQLRQSLFPTWWESVADAALVLASAALAAAGPGEGIVMSQSPAAGHSRRPVM